MNSEETQSQHAVIVQAKPNNELQGEAKVTLEVSVVDWGVPKLF